MNAFVLTLVFMMPGAPASQPPTIIQQEHTTKKRCDIVLNRLLKDINKDKRKVLSKGCYER